VKALVTGASGFIGGAIARHLVERGVDVRVLLRAGSVPNLSEHDRERIEIAAGDLRDADAVHDAARGCEAIFHAGALYSFAADRNDLDAINVGGTRNVLDAARATGARVVHTSSISTIGGMRGGLIPDEDQEPVFAPGPYKASKWKAERLVRDAAMHGVDAVIVNPTFPVGWGDVKPTPTGAMIRDFIHGRLPAYLDTGMNVVDVDDVAEGHRLAAERGQRGRRYILGNANLTMRELLERLAALCGRRAPRVRLPYVVALGLAYTFRGRVPLEGVRTAREIRFASSERAIRELGFPQRPVQVALEAAVRWFQLQPKKGGGRWSNPRARQHASISMS
jgi:dihydroflavonol-4-reductase